jgi:hypothetical protein
MMTDSSLEADEDSVLRNKNKNVNINFDNLRPPHVWNFPYEKAKKQAKIEEERVELRLINLSKITLIIFSHIIIY